LSRKLSEPASRGIVYSSIMVENRPESRVQSSQRRPFRRRRGYSGSSQPEYAWANEHFAGTAELSSKSCGPDGYAVDGRRRHY